MNLIREHWTNVEILEFQNYLMQFSKGKEKGEWERRTVNTALPCIAVPSYEVKRISKEIAKGNFLEFIDLWIWTNYTETAIIGNLIGRIKEFDLLKSYLVKYGKMCDNWATCDVLKLQIKPNNKQQFFELANEFCKSEYAFMRRIGLTTLFKFIDKEYIDKVLILANSFFDEQEYYVNMANAWLIAECFIKQKEKTLRFLQSHQLNKFTINKTISKCRDSFRVSIEDKEMLLKYRQK